MQITKVTKDMHVTVKIFGSEKRRGAIDEIVAQLSNSSFEVSVITQWDVNYTVPYEIISKSIANQIV